MISPFFNSHSFTVSFSHDKEAIMPSFTNVTLRKVYASVDNCCKFNLRLWTTSGLVAFGILRSCPIANPQPQAYEACLCSKIMPFQKPT